MAGILSKKVLLSPQIGFTSPLILNTPGFHNVLLPVGKYKVELFSAAGAGGNSASHGSSGGAGGNGVRSEVYIKVTAQDNIPVKFFVGSGGKKYDVNNPSPAMGGSGGLQRWTDDKLYFAGGGGGGGEPTYMYAKYVCYRTQADKWDIQTKDFTLTDYSRANWWSPIWYNNVKYPAPAYAENTPITFAFTCVSNAGGGGGGGGGAANNVMGYSYPPGGAGGGGGGCTWVSINDDTGEVTIKYESGGNGGDGGNRTKGTYAPTNGVRTGYWASSYGYSGRGGNSSTSAGAPGWPGPTGECGAGGGGGAVADSSCGGGGGGAPGTPNAHGGKAGTQGFTNPTRTLATDGYNFQVNPDAGDVPKGSAGGSRLNGDNGYVRITLVNE